MTATGPDPDTGSESVTGSGPATRPEPEAMPELSGREPETQSEVVAGTGGAAPDVSPTGDVSEAGEQSGSPGEVAARRGRRELTAWLVVTALGCVLVLVAAGRAWVTNVRGAGTGAMTVPSGGDLSPVLTPLALAGLAGVVAVLATKGAGRRVIGVLLALCGVGAGLGAWQAAGGSGVLSWLRERNVMRATGAIQWDVVPLWPVVCGLGAVLMVAGGVVAVVRGGAWAGMSAKYTRERPETTGDRSMWDALDRGDDPT
ncbi:Trp biosynthesis-associated membrane protein [Nonomuraea sp. NPDC052129]|uniref:Trp biosynthesis-associated membrane protein n=1 Tax=Nonomuraea sp. NPDC052129 TaxID=3154651 RepID=UPI0034314023